MSTTLEIDLICSKLRFLWGYDQPRIRNQMKAKPSGTTSKVTVLILELPKKQKATQAATRMQLSKRLSLFLSLDSTSFRQSFTNF